MVDNAVKNAPAGTENAVVLVKSAVAAANNAFESVQKAAKQAADVAEANFQAISSSRCEGHPGCHQQDSQVGLIEHTQRGLVTAS